MKLTIIGNVFDFALHPYASHRPFAVTRVWHLFDLQSLEHLIHVEIAHLLGFEIWSGLDLAWLNFYMSNKDERS